MNIFIFVLLFGLVSSQTTTAPPTTAVPTTAAPTTAVPTTAVPTTAAPTTAIPTTAAPTTAAPTTAKATTAAATTGVGSTTTSLTPAPSPNDSQIANAVPFIIIGGIAFVIGVFAIGLYMMGYMGQSTNGRIKAK